MVQKGLKRAPRWAKLGQDCSKCAPTKPQNHPRWLEDVTRWSQDGPSMAQDGLRCLSQAVFGFHLGPPRALPGFAFVLPSFCIRFAFALPSLCLHFAFALLSFCLRCAFASRMGESQKLSTKQEPTTIDANIQVGDRKRSGEAFEGLRSLRKSLLKSSHASEMCLALL